MAAIQKEYKVGHRIYGCPSSISIRCKREDYREVDPVCPPDVAVRFQGQNCRKIQDHTGFESLRTCGATKWQTGFLLECNANRRWGKRLCTAACAVLYAFVFWIGL